MSSCAKDCVMQVETSLHLHWAALHDSVSAYVYIIEMQFSALLCAALPVSSASQRAPCLRHKYLMNKWFIYFYGVVVSMPRHESASLGLNPGQSMCSSSSLFGLVSRMCAWENLWRANCGNLVLTSALYPGVMGSCPPQAQGPKRLG